MAAQAETEGQEKVDEATGFRPLLTRAPLLGTLVASPTEYDAAPAYLIREYLAQTRQVRKSVLEHQTQVDDAGGGSDTVGRQVGIALELVAPIGFGIVRAHALAMTAAHYLLVAGNPVTAVLSAPALFLTGKQLVTDLRRAFTTDPKVRELSTRAARLVDAGDFRRAEVLLKEALEQDINPDYRRNGDLYLQLGLAQMRDGRPRQAMVAFARASVLFRESDGFRIERDGRAVEVSKRGIAELLAVSAIDSFASSDSGLDEWAELLGDFATSATKRLEDFASGKERGRVFGLFGLDPAAAEVGRELIAKVAFLSAKMNLRHLGSSVSTDQFERLLSEGLAQLEEASLSAEDHLNALLEQAQFYASSVSAGPQAALRARTSLRLLARAADLVQADEPKTAARLRAEALAFLMEVAPEIAGTQDDATSLSTLMLPVVGALEKQLQAGELEGLPLAPLLHGWLPEKRYLLSDEPAARRNAIRSSVAGYQQAGEPVAAMHSALRLAYCADGAEEKEAALDFLRQSAQGILDGPQDPVSLAFAGKYLLDAAGSAAESARLDRGASAVNFLQAADWVRSERGYIAFYVHGKPIIHAWESAELVLRGHAAGELARNGQELEALSILAQLEHRLDGAPPRVKQSLDVERALYLLEVGQRDEAIELLERIEREARESGALPVQRRALQLLAAAERSGSGLARAAGLQRAAVSGEGPGAEPAPLIDHSAGHQSGLMGGYASARDQFLKLGARLLEILEAPDLQRQLAHTSGKLEERVRGRIDRVERNLFRIGIVGEFSSGKSTFLNAVMGSSVLPSSIRPTTSVVNVVRYGEEPGLQILLESGEEERAALSALADYVTERRNPGNERGVAKVVIQSPVDLLRDGVELIDTPGLQSLVEAHTETTYALVPTCDAIVLIAAARQPFSESLATFLDDLRGFVDDKVFYVVNKIDQLAADGARQALNFAEERVAQHVEGATVFPVSAYRALAARRLASGEASAEDYEDDPRLGDVLPAEEMLDTSGLLDLEGAIGVFLSRTRGLPLLFEQAFGFAETLSEVEELLAAERQAAALSLQELRDAHRRLGAEHAQQRARAEDALSGLESELRDRLREVRARMLKGVDDAAASAAHRIVLTAADIASEEALEHLRNRVRAFVRSETTPIVRLASDEIREAVERHRLHARQELRRLRSDLRSEFSEVLGIEAGDALSSMEVAAVHVEAESWGVAVGNFALGGMLGLVGSFLLGPIGIGLAIFGSGFIENWLRGRRVEAAQGHVNDALERAFTAVRQQLATEMERLCEEVVLKQACEVGEARDEILEQFDLQLATLADGAAEERQVGQKRGQQVRELQARAAGLRGELRRFARTWGAST